MFRRKSLWSLVALLLLATVIMTACKGAEDGGNGEFVFGVILAGPHDDHGWSEAHFDAGKYVEENVSNTRMIYSDELDSADRKGTTLEQVVDDMVADGARLIFTTSDDLAADTDVVAAKYPDVDFLHISGDHAHPNRPEDDKAPENVANYMSKMEYMQAVAGCAAALKTETKSIGYLGSLVNDETRRLASAAYLGCRHCYEKYRGGDPEELRFSVTWIGFWYDIPEVTRDPKDVANDFFDAGADVLLSGLATTEAMVVAGQRYDAGEKVWAIPYDFEGACAKKPEICLGTPYFNWGPAYVRFVNASRGGKFKQDWEWEAPYWRDINNRDRSAVGYAFGAALTEEDQEHLEEYIKDLSKGKAKLFVGPLYLQDGTTYLSDGDVATDEKIWYLPQLLRGMEGASY